MRAAALMAAVLATGCGPIPPAPPEWVANRLPLPSCGEEGEDGRVFDVPVRTCLLDAYRGGRAAEMISTESTIEGDPITRYIRVHDYGVVEIFVDWTRDQFSSRQWERDVCQELISVGQANARHGAEVYVREQVFVEEDCREEPIP